MIATGNSAIVMDAWVSSTLFPKVSSRKALGPWLYAAFISAVYELGVGRAFEMHSEDLNCKKKKKRDFFPLHKENKHHIQLKTLSVALTSSSRHCCGSHLE